MAEEEQSLEEWLAEERARLKEGFSYETEPSSDATERGHADDVPTGLGLGAGAISGHPNPVTFEGCKPDTIVDALISEITGDDTRVEVRRSDESVVVTILQSQEHHRFNFAPALTVTLLESRDTLTVTMSDLSEDVKRSTIGSIGRSALHYGSRLLFRGRGLRGMLDKAGSLMQGVEDVTEDLQDLSLPRRVWAVIDPVGGAAEDAYLEEQRRKRALERKREAAERAWTHCEWCGRAYAEDEEDIVQCPSCGAARGSKPDWLD